MMRGSARLILEDMSKKLGVLLAVSGLHSVLLVVDPTDSADGAFLGGSRTGVEFWSGLRNGGVAGTRSFKEYCKSSLKTQTGTQIVFPATSDSAATGTRRTPAVALKNRLYAAMRESLRCVLICLTIAWTRHDIRPI